jgi:DNA-directed RNA polymerase subunit RPC12/RpoP
LLGLDANNSSIPTSKTPIGKPKRVPNSRVKTGKKIGGQPGHEKHRLSKFVDNEITGRVAHSLDKCTECGSAELEKLQGTIEKDCLDFRIVVERTRHEFESYRCACCGKEVHAPIPDSLKEENQYGPQVQAFALSLMNVGNVPINKVRRVITGLSEGGLAPSEGYLAKLQKRASRNLYGFVEDERKALLGEKIVHWDDTVIDVDAKKACLRFYGNESLALYKAHEHKNKEGLVEDGILPLLGKDTVVVHDHLSVNRNKDFGFTNAECNTHPLRDLQRVSEIFPGHKWPARMISLLTGTNDEKKRLLEAGADRFSQDKLSEIINEYLETIVEGDAENGSEPKDAYYAHEEKLLLVRLLEYKNEHLLFAFDFDVPFSNNLAERSLRGAKSKMKAAGQFQNIKTAGYYADVKSYIETCHRNDINEYVALVRLCIGEPLTLKEILDG